MRRVEEILKARSGFLAAVCLAVTANYISAQNPVLSNIETTYPAIQSSVSFPSGQNGPGAGPFGPGRVAYGPVGAPLVLAGSNFNGNVIVTFIGYWKGGPTTSVQVSVTPISSTLISLNVPAGARSGMVVVSSGLRSSTPVPFVVTNGTYNGQQCPAYPPGDQLQITTSSIHDGTAGQSYSAALSRTGGTPPFTWSITSGSLPSGLTLNGSTGAISGTPTIAGGPVIFTAQVADSSTPQQRDQATLNLTIQSQTLTSATIYSYCVPGPSNPACSAQNPGFDSAGNLTQYQDSINGNWLLSYDNLNRLSTAYDSSGATGYDSSHKLCFNYDSFGNRTRSDVQSTCNPNSDPANSSFNSQNQLTAAPNSVPGAFTYDAAGNTMTDNLNQYLYDAEGRICAVWNKPAPGFWTMTGYLYNAEGQRIAKGPITTMSCDPAISGLQPTGPGTTYFVLNSSGETSTAVDGANNPQWSNFSVSGKLLGTYNANGLHFHITDPLGTRRMQVSAIGQPETDMQNLPFGNQLSVFTDPNAPPSADDAAPNHFTGKERDAESGNDYFPARYYASSMGRWLSPDPGGMAVVDLEFPQTLNRYAYVNNNPLSFTDPFGLDCAYLNNAGNGVESVDQQSNAGECGKNGGYWVNGGLTNININADQGSVQMTGTTNGTDQTHASYQDANVVVSEWNNTIANPANHIAISLPGQRPVGQNPLSDSDFISNIALNGFKYNVVPGTIKPQTNTGKLLKVAVIPVTGMQAKMIQAFINQSIANPSNYSLNTQLGLDCATWVQQLLGNAGVQTGPMQPMPNDLMNQLGNMYQVY